MTLRGAGKPGDSLQAARLESHSQQCQGGLSLPGSPSDQRDHPSLGPQGAQGHPKRKQR